MSPLSQWVIFLTILTIGSWYLNRVRKHYYPRTTITVGAPWQFAPEPGDLWMVAGTNEILEIVTVASSTEWVVKRD